MFCKKCGADIGDRKFYTKCGARLAEGAPRPQMTYLDGTPMEFLQDDHRAQVTKYGTPPAWGPGEQPPAQKAGWIPPEAAEEEKPKRPPAQPLIPTFVPGETKFWGKISYMLTDPDSFFSKIEMEKETGAAFAILIGAGLINAAGAIGFERIYNPVTGKQLGAMLIGAGFNVIFPLVVSVTGMIVMSAIYQAYASWTRIFGIYAYAYIFVAVSWIPFVSILTYVLYIYYVYKGFENVFGLETFPAIIFAFGLPFLTKILFVFMIGSIAASRM